MGITRELVFIAIGIMLGLLLIPPHFFQTAGIASSFKALNLPILSISIFIHIFSALLFTFLFIKYKDPILLIIAAVFALSWKLVL